MRSVLVIGAGWAGISAAMSASLRGCMVTVVEERPYIGGRTRSFIDKTTGEEIDNGQHLMMGAYRHTLDILNHLGTRDLVRAQEQLRVPFYDATLRTTLQTASDSQWALLAAVLRVRGLLAIDKLRIVAFATKLRLGIVKADAETCLEFLQRNHQPLSAISRFWEPIVLATLNAPIDKADASLLVAVMKRAFLGNAVERKLLIPQVGLSSLLAPFSNWIQNRGGTVVTSVGCEELIIENQRVVGARFSDGTQWTGDDVILAIPRTAAARLIPANMLAWAHEPSSPIISVYLWYNKNWMEETLVAALGTVIQWVFNRRKMQAAVDAEVEDRYPGHISLTISAGSELAKKEASEIIEECQAELTSLFPEISNAELLHGVVIKEKRATELITPQTVRLTTTALHSIANNLWLAGDCTDTKLPATIEGAAQSGVAAVEAMLNATTIEQAL